MEGTYSITLNNDASTALSVPISIGSLFDQGFYIGYADGLIVQASTRFTLQSSYLCISPWIVVACNSCYATIEIDGTSIFSDNISTFVSIDSILIHAGALVEIETNASTDSGIAASIHYLSNNSGSIEIFSTSLENTLCDYNYPRAITLTPNFQIPAQLDLNAVWIACYEVINQSLNYRVSLQIPDSI